MVVSVEEEGDFGVYVFQRGRDFDNTDRAAAKRSGGEIHELQIHKPKNSQLCIPLCYTYRQIGSD